MSQDTTRPICSSVFLYVGRGAAASALRVTFQISLCSRQILPIFKDENKVLEF